MPAEEHNTTASGAITPELCPRVQFLRNAGARGSSRIGARFRRPGMDLTPTPQFPHSLEKCLKVSEDGLAAGPLAHSVSIQGMAVMRALVQRAAGGEMHESQTQTQKKRKTQLQQRLGYLSFLFSGGCCPLEVDC